MTVGVDDSGQLSVEEDKQTSKLRATYWYQIRLFVEASYIRQSGVEERVPFARDGVLLYGGGFAQDECLSINNLEVRNKFVLLEIVDGIWYGAWDCRWLTTRRQNQMG